MKNILGDLWFKLFGKKEELTLEKKIDLNLQNYISAQDGVLEEKTIKTEEIPQIEEPIKIEETIVNVQKEKRKYVKKVLIEPVKKTSPKKPVTAKKVTKKSPAIKIIKKKK